MRHCRSFRRQQQKAASNRGMMDGTLLQSPSINKNPIHCHTHHSPAVTCPFRPCAFAVRCDAWPHPAVRSSNKPSSQAPVLLASQQATPSSFPQFLQPQRLTRQARRGGNREHCPCRSTQAVAYLVLARIRQQGASPGSRPACIGVAASVGPQCHDVPRASSLQGSSSCARALHRPSLCPCLPVSACSAARPAG